MEDFEFEEGATDAPERIVVYGEGGIGKTAFASGAPRPYFVDLEGGSSRMRHAARPRAPLATWDAMLGAVDALRTRRHDFRTVVLDTVDRAEWYCWKHLCDRDGVSTIEEVAKGYGKGYTAAYEMFRALVGRLEALREARDMHVILLAHASPLRVKNSGGSDYHRLGFKVHEKVGTMLFETADHVLHAARNVVVTDDVYDGARPRAVGGEKRLLRTAGAAAYLAKARAAVPDPIDLSWHAWAAHLASAGFPRLLRETVLDGARRLGDPKVAAQVREMVEGGASVATLAKMDRRLQALLGPPWAPPPAAHDAPDEDAGKEEPTTTPN